MRFELDIDYPVEKMERSRKRMEARGRFRYVDRAPILYCLVARYFAPLFNLRYIDFFKDAETQYYWQLQFAKYRIENIPEDFCTGPAINVAPYFDNILDSAAFGAEAVWPENETLHCRPVISTVEQMERYPMPKPGTGLWGQCIEWCRQMRELARDTRIAFNGVAGQVNVGSPNISLLSPHMIAIDLVGVDFYCWQAEYPEACHRFLGRITDTLIEAQRYFLKLDNRAWGGIGGAAEDTATVMSPAMFKEFCVPYTNRLFDASTSRGIHMCGPSAHLHKALVEDLRITSLDLFGYQVEPKVAAQNLGGKVLLWGNINPMLMHTGARAEVKRTARAALEAMAPCGGLMLGDGANVCPGTPLASFQAIMEAAEEYGLGDGAIPVD